MNDPSAGRRLAVLRVSGSLLADLLLLPPGTEILGASTHLFFDTAQIALQVAAPDLPVVAEGEALPVLCPQYHATRRADGTEVVRLAGWPGLESLEKKP